MGNLKNTEGKITENDNLAKMKRILVVGDWVIDDHWVTGIHRSLTSSRTGQSHRRALHFLNNTIQSFCGAGQTASILHLAKDGKDDFCEIIGIGLWHKDDTNTLVVMLDPKLTKGRTPHRLSRLPLPEIKKGNKLFNLGDILEKVNPNVLYGTTRVIRIYQHAEGDKIDLIQRLDWEISVSQNNKTTWITEEEITKLNECPLNTFLENNTFDAVVIKDMHRGVVSKELIKWLVSKKSLKGKPWFVSSKEWEPNWLEELPKKDLQLLLIPQVAAKMAVQNGILNNWITESGHVSKEALHEMDNLATKLGENSLIIILPEELSILVRDLKKKDHKGWLQKEKKHHHLVVGMPMASVFFSSLVINLLKDKDKDEDKDKDKDMALDKILKRSLDFTQEWMEFEVGRIKHPNDWDPKDEPVVEIDIEKQIGKVGSWEKFDWEETKDRWKKAMLNCGIIDKKTREEKEKKKEEKEEKKRCLELWRAMTEVEGYVCCVNSKRRVLQKLIQEFEDFKLRGKQHPESCMLIASPGSGKTFLVKCLAKSLKMQYLPFNITQMLSKSDILDCFDTIVTTQARNREEPILVFFDEINAKLGAQQVYDIFLAPLEEGIYIRAGKTFHIDPCVWIFAGTECPVKAVTSTSPDASIKASDFESRFTISPLDLKIVEQDREQTKVEKVYLGVSLLRTIFPDVRRISEKVLFIFHCFKPEMEVREIEHFVKSFTNIQYGDVLARNVPENWFDKRHCLEVPLAEWKKETEGEMIEIIG